MVKLHNFHIPVMGIGFTVNTPVNVAQYGISSVISLLDDMLMEKLREMYCEKMERPFLSISTKIKDYRAKRITSYLNLIDEIVSNKFSELRDSILTKRKEFEIEKFIDLLPDVSSIKKTFKNITKGNYDVRYVWNWLKENIHPGDIDVNIMTKVDKPNYKNGEMLPSEFNDAHAALRGFSNSTLSSSIVLSAGLNPRLYSYIENFNDFFPNEKGVLKKRIILKVSDYRSALIQGKFLAKKGLWISEFRIESGLNCGGHAFPSDGYLLGPIMEEFKTKRKELISEIYGVYSHALKEKGKVCPTKPLDVKISVQGGIISSEEHNFFLDYYNLDSIGWGTPFLLVPEAVNTDKETLEILKKSNEEDLYLSDISPFGVRFNNVRGNTKDLLRDKYIKEGHPGSPCIKNYSALNTEFGGQPLCTASRKYQTLKIKELEEKNLNPEEYKKAYNKIVQKSCICVGLGTSALLVNNLDTTLEGEDVSVCPGPSMEFFNKKVSLKKMVDHIYGRKNIIERKNIPHDFIRELKINIDFLKEKIEEAIKPISGKQLKYIKVFQKNLNEGIEYYKLIASKIKMEKDRKLRFLKDLDIYKKVLITLNVD